MGEKLDADHYPESLTRSWFPICHHGYALRTFLVVSGPERGRVWFDGRPEREDLVTERDSNQAWGRPRFGRGRRQRVLLRTRSGTSRRILARFPRVAPTTSPAPPPAPMKNRPAMVKSTTAVALGRTDRNTIHVAG